MSALGGGSKPLVRRGGLVAAFAAGVVLMVAPLSGAVVVNPWESGRPTGAEVAPADGDLSVLEPVGRPAGAPVAKTATKADEGERAVQVWMPTDGGKGGKPKPSPKG